MEIDIPVSEAFEDALSIAARSISTSYRGSVSAEMLAEMLRSGRAPERFHPHLMVFLDELPLPVAFKAIAEAETSAIPFHKIVEHLANWSKEWKTCRAVWTK